MPGEGGDQLLELLERLKELDRQGVESIVALISAQRRSLA